MWRWQDTGTHGADLYHGPELVAHISSVKATVAHQLAEVIVNNENADHAEDK